MRLRELGGELGFDVVLDVGGNVGDFAEAASAAWPEADIVSFEPIIELARANRLRATGRWAVAEVAISDSVGTGQILMCTNQHTASTMQDPGSTRRREFGISDVFVPMTVERAPLDSYLTFVRGASLMVKIDVEGHERQVLAGAAETLRLADMVLIEVQQDADIFLDAPSPHEVDETLRSHGLHFAGLFDAFKAPVGRVLQFDAIYLRES